jgi:integrase
LANHIYSRLLDSGLADPSKVKPGRAGLSVRTVRYIHTIGGAVLKSAVKSGVIARSPADQAEPPRMSAAANGERVIRTWTAEELGDFLVSTRGTCEYALWHLLATTGLRREEALGLGWEHVDLDAARLMEVRTLIDIRDAENDAPIWSDPKTAAGRRSVALDPGTVAALKAHKAERAREQLRAGTGAGDPDLMFT